MIIKAAKKDYAVSQYNLGLIYSLGDYGVEKNYKTAFYWMKKAAENNYSKAQCALSKFYFEGTAIPKDLNKSYFWAYISMKNGYQPAKKVINYLSNKLTTKEISIENRKAEEWLGNHNRKCILAETVPR